MIDPNSPDIFGAMAGLGTLFFFVWLVFTVVIVILAIWIQYTIVWKAVRRGMREFHYGSKDASQQMSGYTSPPTQ